MTMLVSSIQTVAVAVAAVWLAAVIPAGVITALKRHWLYLVAGFLTLGTMWLVGATTLAAPDSWWAARFYDDETARRATRRDAGPQPASVTAASIGSILAAIAVLLLFAAFPSPILGVDGRSLEYSVGGPSFTGGPRPCEHRPDGTWFCRRWDSGGSSEADYRVAVDDFGCWTATREGDARGEGSPKRLSGCITIRDHIRLFDRADYGGPGGAD
jgi:hypothetical protein